MLIGTEVGLTTVSNATINTGVQVSLWYVDLSPLEKYPEVALCGHMVDLFLVVFFFKELPYWFP